MLLIIGTIRLPEGRLDSARPIMASMIEATRAEAGCLDYSYAEDILDPGLIHIAERWTDRAALDAHLLSAHMAKWRASGPSLGIADRNLSLYEAGEPQPL
ncbi:MAG: putative quinol monooxygenase [Azospirillaceae bacterium]|nr:putative quinol monooxygenase [Azospirillaceae bacterium]